MTSTDTLNIALSDSLAYPRLAVLLEAYRRREPHVRIQLREVPFDEQCQGLNDGTFDAGLCQSAAPHRGIQSTAIWHDALAVGVACQHPLLAHKSVPVELVVDHPMITLDAHTCPGYRQQVERLLAVAAPPPACTIEVKSFDLMVTLVAAGYGVCLAPAARIKQYRPLGVVGRPITDRVALTTYLLRKNLQKSVLLDRFIKSIQTQLREH